MVWTTAQGRFGRALHATGIQHPAPTLTCTVTRDENKLSVSAPYAVAVFDGSNVTADPPRTQLWCLLYAQARQADNLDWRNILLDDKQLDWRVEIEDVPERNRFLIYDDVAAPDFEEPYGPQFQRRRQLCEIHPHLQTRRPNEVEQRCGEAWDRRLVKRRGQSVARTLRLAHRFAAERPGRRIHARD